MAPRGYLGPNRSAVTMEGLIPCSDQGSALSDILWRSESARAASFTTGAAAGFRPPLHSRSTR